MTKTYEGVIPILKPAGLTSHDVVARIRRCLKTRRVGHTGTLDPMVTGVLPICVNRATRIVEYLQKQPKTYEAQLIFGKSTTTQDLSGEVLVEHKNLKLDEKTIESVCKQFIGTTMQLPPMYSAIRHNGVRLYELARQGKEVERVAREVHISNLEVFKINLQQTYPEIWIRVTCSKGTYIRTLCVDIGEKMGVPAVMGKLTRTETAGFSLNQCIPLEDFCECPEKVEEFLISTDKALPHTPCIYLNQVQENFAIVGKKLKYLDLSFFNDRDLVRVYGEDCNFIGLFRIDAEEQVLVPEKLFIPKIL